MVPLVVLLCLVCCVSGEYDADCITPTGMASHCIPITQCDKLLPLIHKSPAERETLRDWQCGFDGNVPKMCCPPTGPKKRCYSPNGVPGICVKREECPSIMELLKPPVSRKNLDFVARSKCNSPDVLNVCCEHEEIGDPRKTSILTRTSSNPFDAKCKDEGIPNPMTECCGVESSGGNRIFGGNATAIDQYPWLALIQYMKENRQCGGSLISRRFVLTAAHCLVTSSGIALNAKSVRLGDYNISNEGRDCVEVEGNGLDCNADPVTIDIQFYRVHPEYATSKTLYNANDIALIYLKDSVTYSDFIRPICLPMSDALSPQPSNMTLFVAGWGAVNDTTRSDVKAHVDLPLFNQKQCLKLYTVAGTPLISDTQVCAGGVEGKDSCEGDSGGPLMRIQDTEPIELVGISSFGFKHCGTKGAPAVYTKVYSYMEWIATEILRTA